MLWFLSVTLLACVDQSYGWIPMASPELSVFSHRYSFSSSSLPLPSLAIQRRSNSYCSSPSLSFSSSSFPSTTASLLSSKTALYSSSSWFQDTFSNFLNKRGADFVPLDPNSVTEFGPGPVLILYNVPSGIDQEELCDMLSDGAPIASQKGIALIRLDSSSKRTNPTAARVLESSLSDALDEMAAGTYKTTPLITTTSTEWPLMNYAVEEDEGHSPTAILFFSGFRNDEMMATYRIMASEIYQESGGWVACAKAVPNAMHKSLRQVLEEISGDHHLATIMD